MEKYRVFQKIVKTKPATYLKAEEIEKRENVLVKKLNRNTTWEQLLKDRDLTIMKQSKIDNFPVIQEIVKDQDQFYVILDLQDNNLEQVIKENINKQDIFKIGRQLIKMVVKLTEQKIYPRELRPVHMFIDKTFEKLKLTHVETMPKDISKLDLVELQDLRYLSPEQVLTSQAIDERSAVFSAGLILCECILGSSLLTANTKMNYIYQLCGLFPQAKIHHFQSSIDRKENTGESFDTLMKRHQFSEEFIALLKQMLKMDRAERITVAELLDAFEVIVENEENYIAQKKKKVSIESNTTKKESQNKESIAEPQIHVDLDIQLDFAKKPTLSAIPTIKNLTNILPYEKNIEDDAVQPIIIKQSKRGSMGGFNLNTTKESSRITQKQPSLSTIRKPQLTNYALNEANLGVQMGMNPTLFSDNDF